MIISAGMAVVAAIFYGLATFTQTINPVDPGPAFYPRIVSLLLFVAAMAQAVRTWRSGRVLASEPHRPGRTWPGAASRYVLGTLFLSVVYVCLFDKVPYVVGAVGFLSAVMLLAGVRRWLVLCGAAFGYAVVTYYVFGYVLAVPLP
jgi:hypothetical protein